MKKLLIILTVLLMATCLTDAYAADVTMRWDASADAVGYKIYVSADQGVTWDAGVDVGNVTTYTYKDVPEDGLILFRISAYNLKGEAVRYWDGVWFNGMFKPPAFPSGYGVE